MTTKQAIEGGGARLTCRCGPGCVTKPLRAVSRGLRWLLRNTRGALMVAWWLSTGQFSRAARASLPYYQRFVPLRVRAMIPDRVREAVKRRLAADGVDQVAKDGVVHLCYECLAASMSR